MICRRQGRRSQRETILYIWGAVFGCNCRNKIRINVGEFRDSSAGCNFLENKMLKIDTNYCYNAKARI